MAAVAAAAVYAPKTGYYNMLRSNHKKRKIKVSLDNIIPSFTNTQQIATHKWDKDERRSSLTNFHNIKSMEDKITRSDGCIACTANTVQSKSRVNSPSLRNAVICKQARSVDSCLTTPGQTSPKKCHKSHSHSDFCIKSSRRRHSSGGSTSHSSDDEQTASIDIVSSHSMPKYGTNIKSWTVKVDVRPFTPNGDVTVSAEGHLVKIKAKLPAKPKGFVANLFGSGQKEVKRTLKFAGKVETSTFKTRTDKAGFLTIDLSETLSY